jgi:hypothetical protein
MGEWRSCRNLVSLFEREFAWVDDVFGEKCIDPRLLKKRCGFNLVPKL